MFDDGFQYMCAYVLISCSWKKNSINCRSQHTVLILKPSTDMTSNAAIFDETGMCVVDTAQMKRRIQVMDAQERTLVEKASVRFLYDIVRLAHSHDMRQVGSIVVDLTKLVKDIIMDYNTTFLKTFKGDLFLRNASSSSASETTPKEEALLRVIEVVASSTFNPSNIFAMMCQHFGVGNINECIAKIPAAFNNFNPVYLEDAVWLQCCENDDCSCKTLPEDVNVASPASALVAFFSCMNHKRAYNGVAGFEGAHASVAGLATAGPTARLGRYVRFPLRETLVACVGGGSVEAIRAMSLEDRAFVTMVYTFLFFSRYANVSGDMLNRVLYVIAIKFILKSVEMLYYEYENATRYTDGGLFLKYTVGYLPSVIMAAPFAIEKAYNEWRSDFFAGSILSLVHNSWRNDNSVSDAQMASKVLLDKINYLSQKSKFSPGRNRQECMLGSIRSVRNMENYIPFGLYRVSRGQSGVVTGIGSENGSMIGLVKRHSNGMNLPCNAFSVLSELPPLVQLGPKGRGDQTRFELSIFGNKVKNTNYGRLDGFIMCMIDRLFVNKFQNTFSDDKRANEQITKAISQAVSEVMFERNRAISIDIINNVCMLPDSQNVDRQPIRRGQEIPSMDVGACTVFMPWKRPVVPSPNIDAMGIAQLELTMSRDPKWAPVLTQLFFFMGRISSQIIHSTISNLYGPNPESLETDKGMVIKAMTEAVKHVKSEWVREGGEDELQQQLSLKIGSKRSFNQSKGHTTSSTTELRGPKAGVSLGLYKCLREICIDQDWSPVAIIGYAEFLVRFCGKLDEFLMSVSSNSSSLDFIQGC